ncbi:hypothetical protein E2C01_086139 [Portunus trituberculatus]|uniref:Uncharacterized protein n=1 Tax=Portunus trituberculatus TaxID=210409 RepID=A0A5B7J4M9_PORTR|nr:hypothetical protein [Portunus trituberculatus]
MQLSCNAGYVNIASFILHRTNHGVHECWLEMPDLITTPLPSINCFLAMQAPVGILEEYIWEALFSFRP